MSDKDLMRVSKRARALLKKLKEESGYPMCDIFDTMVFDVDLRKVRKRLASLQGYKKEDW